MSKINLTFKGKKYAIDKSLLSGAIAGLEAAFGELENGGSGDSDSIVGTWRFNDEITSFLQVADTQEKYDNWANNGSNYYSLSGYSMIDGERRNFSEFYCYKISGIFTDGEINTCVLADADDYCFFYEDGGWHTPQTITITEEPSAEVAAWLRMNATKIDGDNNTINKNGYLFYTSNDVNYLMGYEGDDTELILPNDYNGESYQINPKAFWGCTSLTSVTIGDSVTSIGHDAFRDCTSLTSITIPNSVTSIGHDAFLGCTSLTSITIPDSVTLIDGYTFSSCTSLKSIIIPDSVTSIGWHAFYDCKSLTSITIPNSVMSIGTYAFYGCTSLKSIIIPDSVKSIGWSAFYNCTSLTSVTIPDSVTLIDGNAFRDCTSLESITFNGTITQWNAITKGDIWNSSVPATYVQCSDGQAAL